MTVLVFIILFGLSFLVFPCEGEIFLPPEGDTFLVAPGTDVKIAWKFDDKIEDVVHRVWSYTRGELLATISQDQAVDINDNSTLTGIEIEKPSTLVLKNVDSRYNGTYHFQVLGKALTSSSVTVIVAVLTNATVNCSSPITVREGSDVRCLCEAKGGNPAASVTWHKNNVQIGDAGDEEQTLSLRNIERTEGGTYKCVEAQSDNLKDEVSIQVNVNFQPDVPRVTSKPKKAVLRKSVTIECEAEAKPLPNYVIVHNNTRTVSTEMKYTIDVVNANHAGSYKCIANNTLGQSEFTYTLHVTAVDPENDPDDESSSGLGGGAIAGIVIGVLLLLVIIIVVVWWCKFRGNKNEDRRTGVSESGNRNTPIYADVRKDPKKNEPTYAVLDKNALQTGPDASVKRDSGEPTQYADIEFGAVRGDLV